MIYLKQNDLKWAKVLIGKSKETLAKSGCVVTSISMLSSYFKCYKTPPELAKLLSFTTDGLLIWQSVSKKLCFKFVWRYYSYIEADALEAVKNPYKAVMFQVKNYHWVIAVRKLPFSKTWIIADPLTGSISTTLKYGNKITGMATFVEK